MSGPNPSPIKIEFVSFKSKKHTDSKQHPSIEESEPFSDERNRKKPLFTKTQPKVAYVVKKNPNEYSPDESPQNYENSKSQELPQSIETSVFAPLPQNPKRESSEEKEKEKESPSNVLTIANTSKISQTTDSNQPMAMESTKPKEQQIEKDSNEIQPIVLGRGKKKPPFGRPHYQKDSGQNAKNEGWTKNRGQWTGGGHNYNNRRQPRGPPNKYHHNNPSEFEEKNNEPDEDYSPEEEVDPQIMDFVKEHRNLVIGNYSEQPIPNCIDMQKLEGCEVVKTESIEPEFKTEFTLDSNDCELDPKKSRTNSSHSQGQKRKNPTITRNYQPKYQNEEEEPRKNYYDNSLPAWYDDSDKESDSYLQDSQPKENEDSLEPTKQLIAFKFEDLDIRQKQLEEEKEKFKSTCKIKTRKQMEMEQLQELFPELVEKAQKELEKNESQNLIQPTQDKNKQPPHQEKIFSLDNIEKSFQNEILPKNDSEEPKEGLLQKFEFNKLLAQLDQAPEDYKIELPINQPIANLSQDAPKIKENLLAVEDIEKNLIKQSNSKKNEESKELEAHVIKTDSSESEDEPEWNGANIEDIKQYTEERIEKNTWGFNLNQEKEVLAKEIDPKSSFPFFPEGNIQNSKNETPKIPQETNLSSFQKNIFELENPNFLPSAVENSSLRMIPKEENNLQRESLFTWERENNIIDLRENSEEQTEASFNLPYNLSYDELGNSNPFYLNEYGNSFIWYYKDPKQSIQGPFGADKMFQWKNLGYFHNDLPIACKNSNIFFELGEYLKAPNKILFLQMIENRWKMEQNVRRYQQPDSMYLPQQMDTKIKVNQNPTEFVVNPSMSPLSNLNLVIEQNLHENQGRVNIFPPQSNKISGNIENLFQGNLGESNFESINPSSQNTLTLEELEGKQLLKNQPQPYLPSNTSHSRVQETQGFKQDNKFSPNFMTPEAQMQYLNQMRRQSPPTQYNPMNTLFRPPAESMDPYNRFMGGERSANVNMPTPNFPYLFGQDTAKMRHSPPMMNPSNQSNISRNFLMSSSPVNFSQQFVVEDPRNLPGHNPLPYSQPIRMPNDYRAQRMQGPPNDPAIKQMRPMWENPSPNFMQRMERPGMFRMEQSGYYSGRNMNTNDTLLERFQIPNQPYYRPRPLGPSGMNFGGEMEIERNNDLKSLLGMPTISAKPPTAQKVQIQMSQHMDLPPQYQAPSPSSSPFDGQNYPNFR